MSDFLYYLLWAVAIGAGAKFVYELYKKSAQQGIQAIVPSRKRLFYGLIFGGTVTIAITFFQLSDTNSCLAVTALIKKQETPLRFIDKQQNPQERAESLTRYCKIYSHDCGDFRSDDSKKIAEICIANDGRGYR